MPEAGVLDAPVGVGSTPPITPEPQPTVVAGGEEPVTPWAVKAAEDVAANAWASHDTAKTQTEPQVASAQPPESGIINSTQTMSSEPVSSETVGFISPSQTPDATVATPAPATVQEPVPMTVGNPTVDQAKPAGRKIPFGRFGAAVGIAAASILGGGADTKAGQLDQPFPQPTPIVETVTAPPSEILPPITEKATMPPPDIRDVIPAPEIPANESLACPKSEKRTITDGSSMSRVLIEVNGLGRYLKPDGTFDEELIYKDLLCTIYLPENQDQLKKSDPKLAAAVESLKANESITGPVTADMLREVVIKVNDPTRYTENQKPSNPQLHLTYTGDEWAVPDFRPAPSATPTSS